MHRWEAKEQEEVQPEQDKEIPQAGEDRTSTRMAQTGSKINDEQPGKIITVN